jgi:AraC-like DNA-binding protein
VLVIPLPTRWDGAPRGYVRDVDEVAKLAERDITAARAVLLEKMIEVKPSIDDWPDLLARDLISDPDLSLSEWACKNGLHPGSLARGFGQQFEISPDSFRTVTRGRRALERIMSTDMPLSAVAVEEGFADQPHMSRTLKRLTGLTPQLLRRHLRPGASGARPSPHASILAMK